MSDVRLPTFGASGPIVGPPSPGIQVQSMNFSSVQEDREMVSFLSRAQPSTAQMSSVQRTEHTPVRGVPGGAGVYTGMPEVETSCVQAEGSNARAEGLQVPPGLGDVEASPLPPTQAELAMLIKTIQSFVEFPKLELGDPTTRANRLLVWKSAIREAIIPAGVHLEEWWEWCLKEANIAYRVYMQTDVHQREL